jgi:hypothetical protein
MDIDTQCQEVKEHSYETVEEIDSNDGSKCTKNKHFRKRILHLQEILLKTIRSRFVEREESTS